MGLRSVIVWPMARILSMWPSKRMERGPTVIPLVDVRTVYDLMRNLLLAVIAQPV